MRCALLLLATLAGLAALSQRSQAAPSPSHSHSHGHAPKYTILTIHHRNRGRGRRSLWDWSVSDFFNNVALQVHQSLANARHWVAHLFSWSHKEPRVGKETVLVVKLPSGGHQLVRIVEFISGRRHTEEMVWTGHHLVWARKHGKHDKDSTYEKDDDKDSKHGQHGKDNTYEKDDDKDSKHGKHGKDNTYEKEDDEDSKHGKASRVLHARMGLRVTHGTKSYDVPLDVLGQHLKHVRAGTRIVLELLGKTWKDLRIVLHVKQRHGKEAPEKGVSVLVKTLVKEAERLHQQHHKHGDDKEHREHSDEDHHKKSKHSNNTLIWTGRGLAWDDSNQSHGKEKRKHGVHRLLVSQDGVAHVIPLWILAKHVKNVPAGTRMDLEVLGKTLSDTRVVLHVHVHREGKGDKTRSITIPVVQLIKEADMVNQGGKDFHGGNVSARIEVNKNPTSHVQRIAPAKETRPSAAQV